MSEKLGLVMDSGVPYAYHAPAVVFLSLMILLHSF